MNLDHCGVKLCLLYLCLAWPEETERAQFPSPATRNLLEEVLSIEIPARGGRATGKLEYLQTSPGSYRFIKEVGF